MKLWQLIMVLSVAISSVSITSIIVFDPFGLPTFSEDIYVIYSRQKPNAHIGVYEVVQGSIDPECECYLEKTLIIDFGRSVKLHINTNYHITGKINSDGVIIEGEYELL